VQAKKILLNHGIFTILAISALAWGMSSLVHDLPSKEYRNNFLGIFSGKVLINNLEQYIIQNTKPEDEVRGWHIHLGINCITDRKAPSRFLFPLNLFIPPSEHNRRLAEYINDLEKQPAKLILVQEPSSISLPFVDQPVDSICNRYCTPEFVRALEIPQIYQEWLRFQQFFNSNYVLDRKIYDWVIYRYSP
jgi:hypothetical protein